MPPLVKLVIVDIVDTLFSLSVAVSFKHDSSTSNNTQELIGLKSVFSTKPNVTLRDFTISSFEI